MFSTNGTVLLGSAGEWTGRLVEILLRSLALFPGNAASSHVETMVSWEVHLLRNGFFAKWLRTAAIDKLRRRPRSPKQILLNCSPRTIEESATSQLRCTL